MIKRGDSLEIEKNITSMLDKVLNDDSEGEEREDTRQKDKEEIRRKEKKCHTVINNKNDGINYNIFVNGERVGVTFPKFPINKPRGSEENVQNYNQFVNGMNNSPYNRVMRSDKRTNTINYKILPNFRNLIGGGNFFNLNFNQNHSSSFSQKISENYCSNSSTNSSYAHLHLSPNENIQLFSLNEFDEVLEKKVRPTEKLNEESYEILQGNFFKVLTSQNGSRVLQKALKNTSREILSKIFIEIEEKISDLMVDSYANYFCQKFFSVLNESERKRFLLQLKVNIVEIGNSKVGTYPLQAIIDSLVTAEEKKIIIDSFVDKVIVMSLDAQGTHVIEKMLTFFEEDKIVHIYQAILNNFIKLAVNVNGLCVVKKTIIHSQDIETLNAMRDLLTENSLALVQNPFGNYALQVAFECWSFEFCLPIVEKFFGHFYELSLQKYSSNVIEKCFERNEDVIITTFVNEICQDFRITDLMKNSYGNYVVQKALKLATGANKFKLTICIRNNLDRLTDKKLVNKWKTIVNNSLHLNINNSDMNGLNISNSSNDSARSNKSSHIISASPEQSPSQMFFQEPRVKSSVESPIIFTNNPQNFFIMNNINNGMNGNVLNSQLFQPNFYPFGGQNVNNINQ